MGSHSISKLPSIVGGLFIGVIVVYSMIAWLTLGWLDVPATISSGRSAIAEQAPTGESEASAVSPDSSAPRSPAAEGNLVAELPNKDIASSSADGFGGPSLQFWGPPSIANGYQPQYVFLNSPPTYAWNYSNFAPNYGYRNPLAYNPMGYRYPPVFYPNSYYSQGKTTPNSGIYSNALPASAYNPSYYPNQPYTFSPPKVNVIPPTFPQPSFSTLPVISSAPANPGNSNPQMVSSSSAIQWMPDRSLWPPSTNFQAASVPTGTLYWHLVRALYCDSNDTRNNCPNLPGGGTGTSTYVMLLNQSGGRAEASLQSPSGQTPKSSGDMCNCNYAFLDGPTPVQIGGYPSDSISGLILYSVQTKLTNYHVRYFLTFQLSTK
jgi:hypothetical protein